MSESLEHFLSRSAASGVLDSTGQFTIDLEKARQKTIQYGLDRPDKGLLKLVQAAVDGQAATLSVKVLSNELVLEINGSRSLERQAEQAGDPLSVALWSCLYSGFDSLTCETARKAWRLTREGFTELDASGSVLGLRIRMHRVKLKGFWHNFRAMLQSRSSEASILQDRLERCHLPVELDGRVINRSAEKVWLREKLVLRLQLIGPDEASSDQIFGGSFGLVQAKVNFRNTVKLESPGTTWTTFAAMQRPAHPHLFGASWDPATYMGSGRVLAELLLPLERTEQELIFVKHGVEIGKVSSPLRGSISSLGVDVDASGLSLVNNERLSNFLQSLYNCVATHLGDLGNCGVDAEVWNAICDFRRDYHRDF